MLHDYMIIFLHQAEYVLSVYQTGIGFKRPPDYNMDVAA